MSHGRPISPAPPARRHLLTLVELGYAESDGKFFSLTARVLRLGHEHVTAAPLPEAGAADSANDRRQDRTRSPRSRFSTRPTASSSLAQRAIESCRLRLAWERGCRRTAPPPVAWCSPARSDAEVERFLAGIRPMKYTHKTKSGHQLMEEIRKARSNGFAISDEEYEIGLRSIAVPCAERLGRNGRGASPSAYTPNA